MNSPTTKTKFFGIALIGIWIVNCILMGIIAIREVWIPQMNAAGKAYQSIKSDPFNGTVLPISHIPNWSKASLRDKSLMFDQISKSDLIRIPLYEPNSLLNENNLIERFTYTVPYMGSYNFNYKENDGSHIGVDIRAPIGTPIVSIANGVVVRAVKATGGANQFVVIRHDNIPMNGKNVSLYSGYLHLHEVIAQEGKKIAKGEILGTVGNTGIATTPHLHFQIDTQDAPFHPYWPFSFSEAQKQGMNVFQAVSAGLGSDLGEKYTINPLIFVQKNLSNYSGLTAYNPPKLEKPQNKPKVENLGTPLESIVRFQETNDKTPSVTVASHITYNTKCSPLQNIQGSLRFKNSIAKFHNSTCAFAHINSVSEHKQLTRSEALLMLMRFYKKTPATGISTFLDIPLNNTLLHQYALVAQNEGIFHGEILRPDDIISRGEFIEVISRFGKLKQAPENYQAFTDVDNNSSLFRSNNNYGFTVGVKGRKLSPYAPLTQTEAMGILNNLLQ